MTTYSVFTGRHLRQVGQGEVGAGFFPCESRMTSGTCASSSRAFSSEKPDGDAEQDNDWRSDLAGSSSSRSRLGGTDPASGQPARNSSSGAWQDVGMGLSWGKAS